MKNLLLSALLLCCSYFTSQANTWFVTVTSDTGQGSLRAAIDSANSYTGLDSVVLQLTAHDTIYLASPLPVITDSLVITGMPCQNPTISGDSISFSQAAISASGYLCLNYLNIFNCISNSASSAGGAVHCGGVISVDYCYFYGNSTSYPGANGGGAIYALKGWVYNSSFNGNSSLSNGLGGALNLPLAHVFNCTFINNYAQTSGGAFSGGSVGGEIQNCTFNNNSAFSGSAVAHVQTDSSFIIGNSIIWGNISLDTITWDTGAVSFSSHGNSGGCNILQDSLASDSFMYTAGDVTGVNPQFGTFGYYSGCVPVLPIMCGSIAQNHASCAGATDTDAQGIAAQGVRDAGAFETSYPHLYSDTLDSIEPGTTADLYNYFNTTGLTIQWPDTLNDSTAQFVDTGTYTIIGTNFLGCSDTASITIIYATDTTLGISNTNFSNNLRLFPNPARDEVTISWTQKTPGQLLLKITDMLSREVLGSELNGQSGNYTIQLSQLSAGAYCVRLADSRQNSWTAKLLVIR